MTVREGRWDCQYCGTTGILGRHKVCPNCAKSRPEGTKFYLPEDEDAVKDAALQEQAAQGPDWICEFCGSSNPANLDVCRHCNAPREGTSPQQQVKEFAAGAAPPSGDMTVPDPHEKYRAPQEAAKKGLPKWLLPVAGVFILFVSLFALDVFTGDYSLGQLAVALFMHLIPTFVLLLILRLAWRWEWIGGLVCIAAALFFLIWLVEPGSQLWAANLLFVIPLLLVGVLFLLNWTFRDEMRNRPFQSA